MSLELNLDSQVKSDLLIDPLIGQRMYLFHFVFRRTFISHEYVSNWFFNVGPHTFSILLEQRKLFHKLFSYLI